MREVRCGGLSQWRVFLAVALLAASTTGILSKRAEALIKYGPLQISGNLETQNLIRDPEIDQYQFIQNRNTARLRFDWDWLQNGKFLDSFNVPFIERSKLFVLYRGVYDGFYDIAPGGRMIGQTKFDDIIGGPIIGNPVGQCVGGSCSRPNLPFPAGDPRNLLHGLYSRINDDQRRAMSWENTLREAYIDLKIADAPLSFRLGRQQVIWGESDQFRLMDIWNPLDVTWHFQQESWDNIRIPLWLGKGLWDIGELGPLSNTFLELVYNPFDFQPNAKLTFLPQPWGVPFPDPLRDGQIQQVGSNYFTTRFDLQGTSIRRGDFKRNPQDASEVGVRFHGVTPQGLEFSANYLYARARGVGANGPLGVKINEVDLYPGKSTAALGSLNNAGSFTFLDGSSRGGIGTAVVHAKVKFPYNHIFGLTANYFEGDYTSAVWRMETAYVTGEPFQTVEPDKLAPAKICLGGATCLNSGSTAPLGFDKRDSWAGMIGFDRPTWIRPLNSKATWFLTGQFFWSYIPGNVSFLRGNGNASNAPYFSPTGGAAGSGSQGVGTWTTGPYGGIMERLQAGSCSLPGGPRCLTASNTVEQGDVFHRWEHLITFAGTSFYRSGTIVPFIADAWDPVDDNDEILWNVDYYYSNNFIITLQQKFFTTYGSHAPSNDPWFAAGRFDRRDETGVKLTYQF